MLAGGRSQKNPFSTPYSSKSSVTVSPGIRRRWGIYREAPAINPFPLFRVRRSGAHGGQGVVLNQHARQLDSDST